MKPFVNSTGFWILVVLGVVAFFYAEENIRGSMEWTLTQKRLKAKGESLNYQDLIPPEVPDAQNLGALPIFQLVPGSAPFFTPEAVAIQKATAVFRLAQEIMPMGSWQKGTLTDPLALKKYVDDLYQKNAQSKNEKLDTLEKIDALCPDLKALREATAIRPFCRFLKDYTSEPAFNRGFGSSTYTIQLTKILNAHAMVALQEHQPDVALQDILTTLKIDEGLRQEPILVSGLVAIGDVAIQMSSIWEGLNTHVWNDPQLTELQTALRKIDFLENNQHCLKGEALGFTATTFDYTRDHHPSATLLFTMSSSSGGSQLPAEVAARLIPSGWFDMAKSRGVTFEFRVTEEIIDIGKRCVYPQKFRRLEGEITDLRDSFSLPDLVLGIFIDSLIDSVKKFTQGQVFVDQAVIACALERYHLAHGSYPENLDELKSYMPTGLPHDPIGGAPYHYQPQPDGGYILYSIGWNEIDDGGKTVFQASNPKSVDYDQGDWVWATPKAK